MGDNNNANGNLHVIVPDESSIQDHETPNPANCMYKTPAIDATQYTTTKQVKTDHTKPTVGNKTDRRSRGRLYIVEITKRRRST